MLKMSLAQKAIAVIALLAMAFSSVAVTTAFAKGKHSKELAAAGNTAKVSSTTAGSSNTQLSTQAIQSDWKSDLSRLALDNAVLSRAERIVNRIERHFSKHPDQDDRTGRADRDDRLRAEIEALLKDFDQLLAKAQAVAKAHAGFDANGNLTNQAQAQQSLQTLNSDLAAVRSAFVFHIKHFNT